MGDRWVFEYRITVSSDDLDGMGHVNNVVYLRYAQDAAVAHWKAGARAELRESLRWVVRRHEIEYLRPAHRDERLVARTWVGALEGATFERFVELTRPSDAQVIARVRSVWVAVDEKTRRPRRVPRELLDDFAPRPDPNGSDTPSDPEEPVP